MVVVLGDFNGKSSNWFKHDKNSSKGITEENVTSQYGLQKIINEPTHKLESSSSFIDQIFTSQPYLIVDFGEHPSLHPNCHHQIVFAKFYLKIYNPPPYDREMWHCKYAKVDFNRQPVDFFNWKGAFPNAIFPNDGNPRVDILIQVFQIHLVTLFHMKF